MRIDEITVFVRVLEAGSFTAAARQLGMPVTTVSAKVAALEKRLRTTLINRTTRQLHATPAGEFYLQRCRDALGQIELAEAEMKPDSDEPSGTLRITVPTVLGRSALPELIAGYCEAFPAVKVEALVMDRKADMLAEKIDLAIRVGPLQDSSLIVRKWLEGAGGLYASAAYVAEYGSPETADDLARHKTIGFSRGDDSAQMMLCRGEIVEVKLNAPVTSNDFYMSRSLIALGMGIGYLPPPMERAWQGEEALVRVLPEYSSPIKPVYFVYPSQRFVPARVRAFIAFADGQADLAAAEG
jgi:DNA-binding transcriptional LysR family regulator